MKQFPKYYLKTLRLKSGLTQRDVAYLLGLKSHYLLSRIELAKQRPSVDMMLALSVIYTSRVAEMIPRERKSIESDVMNRANSLYVKLLDEKKTSILKWRLKIIEQITDQKIN